MNNRIPLNMDDSSAHIEIDRITHDLINLIPYKSKKEKVMELSKLLDLKNSAVYNRINRQTSFSFEEIIKICQTYNISLDSLIFKRVKDDVPHPFYSDSAKELPRTYIDYFNNIQRHVEQIDELTNVRAYIMLGEFSMLHLLEYENLMYLKLFMWNIVSWNNGDIFETYDPELLIQQQDYQVAKRAISQIYLKTNSYEFWNDSMFKYLIRSVRFVKSAGIISDRDLRKIYLEMEMLYQALYIGLMDGYKYDKSAKNRYGKRTVYFNESLHENEMIFVESDEIQIVFKMYDTPNYLRSTGKIICDHTKHWIERVRSQSTEITHSSKLKKMALLREFRSDIDNHNL